MRMFAFTRKRISILLLLGLAVTAVILLPSVLTYYDISQARAAYKQRKWDRARELLESATHRDSTHAEAEFLLARVHRKLAQPNLVHEHLDRARQLGYPEMKLQREWWLMLAQSGQLMQVEHRLPGLLSEAEHDGPEICAAFVNGYCLNLKFREALTLISAWEADWPESAEPHFQRGNLWFARSVWRDAEKSFRKTLQIEDRFEARHKLAQCLLQQHRTEQAETEFRTCLSQRPQHIGSLIGLGNCLTGSMQIEEASELFEQVVELEPEHFEARRVLGQFALADNRPQEALDWLQPLAEKWPEDWSVSYLTAQAYRDTGQQDKAREQFEMMRSAEKSLDELEQLVQQIEKKPLDVNKRYQIGDMVLRFRSREEGVAWLKSALLIDPTHAPTRKALADYYTACGDTQRAKQYQAPLDRQTEDAGSATVPAGQTSPE